MDTTNTQIDSPLNRWHPATWGSAALLLLLPLVAMQFTTEVSWRARDFAVFAMMLIGACGSYELATRMSANTAYRAAAGLAVATAFLLVWANGAVGVIGDEGEPANLMYAGVLGVAIIGAVLGRMQPRGMALTLAATTLAQILVALIALMAGWGNTLLVTALFSALWLISAWLFQKSARQQATV